MKLLLDTHALLWWINPSDRLSRVAFDAISDVASEVIVSAVTAFEITTKHRIGKLPGVDDLINDFEAAMAEEGFGTVSVTMAHGLLAGKLPIPHRDPFDRLLIAQAQIEQALLVSNETLFDQFAVRRLW